MSSQPADCIDEQSSTNLSIPHAAYLEEVEEKVPVPGGILDALEGRSILSLATDAFTTASNSPAMNSSSSNLADGSNTHYKVTSVGMPVTDHSREPEVDSTASYRDTGVNDSDGAGPPLPNKHGAACECICLHQQH